MAAPMYTGLFPSRLLSLPVKGISMADNDLDSIWQAVNSLFERCEELETERCEELETRVSLLEKELIDDGYSGPDEDDDEGAMGNILDSVEGQDGEEFLGEVTYDPN